MADDDRSVREAALGAAVLLLVLAAGLFAVGEIVAAYG